MLISDTVKFSLSSGIVSGLMDTSIILAELVEFLPARIVTLSLRMYSKS